MKDKLLRNPFSKWDEDTFEKCLLLLQMLWAAFITFEGKKGPAQKNLNLCKTVNPDDMHLWKLTEEFTK